MEIVYNLEPELSSEEFVAVLRRSTLAERRPVDRPEMIAKMLRHADLILTARSNGKLVGVSRAITDFGFSTYLSDLAVRESRRTQAAVEYYPRVGMTQHPSAWILREGEALR